VARKLPEIIEIDKSLNELCKNSINLIEYARGITAKQINIIQLMTFYSIGRWSVEEQQQGESRAKYGQRVIKRLSEALTQQYGRGFLVDTLENARRFSLHIKIEFPKQCLAFLKKKHHSRFLGLIIFN